MCVGLYFPFNTYIIYSGLTTFMAHTTGKKSLQFCFILFNMNFDRRCSRGGVVTRLLDEQSVSDSG
jgi:hypothetical protein